MHPLTVFYIIAAFLAGCAAGFLAAYYMRKDEASTAKSIAEELFRESELLRREERDAVIDRIRASFGDLSLDALKKSTDQFIKIANESFKSERSLHSKELESKKGLIDQQLQRMTGELEKVSSLVNDFEKDREKKFGELNKQLEETGKNTNALIKTTNTLREALAGSKSRGQWGERMAEDVLRLAGFLEHVNYDKQKAIPGSGEIPDFTFFLPRHLVLNMDVKFPYDNYIRYLESDSDSDRESYRKQFLRDVRGRIKEVATRGYINPDQNTVDFVLLFIPNEQIYAFIHEQDASLLDEGISKRVIICSPVTLFAVLSVIRAAVENFALEQTSNRILALLGGFREQWLKFVEASEKLGSKIDRVQMDYDNLFKTRKRQLERPLNEIDSLRSSRNIAVESVDDDNRLDMPDEE